MIMTMTQDMNSNSFFTYLLSLLFFPPLSVMSRVFVHVPTSFSSPLILSSNWLIVWLVGWYLFAEKVEAKKEGGGRTITQEGTLFLFLKKRPENSEEDNVKDVRKFREENSPLSLSLPLSLP